MRGACAAFGVDHAFGRIRHTHDCHAEMQQGNHHRQRRGLLSALRRCGGGEAPRAGIVSVDPLSDRLPVESVTRFICAEMLTWRVGDPKRTPSAAFRSSALQPGVIFWAFQIFVA